MKNIKEGNEREIIEHEDEINALTDYIQNNWTGWDSVTSKENNQPALKDFVSFVYYQAINDSQTWFDEHEINFETLYDMEDERRDFLKQTSLKNVYQYDTLYDTFSALRFSFSDIQKAFTGYPQWDFSHQADNALKNAKKFFNNLDSKQLSPINWKKEYNKKENNTSYENFQNSIINSFSGHNSAGIRSLNFPENLYFKNVFYNENEQGLSKERTLISAIYSHALGISENNNTVEIKKALNEFNEQHKHSDICGQNIDTSALNDSPLTQLALVVSSYQKEEKSYTIQELTEINNKVQKKKDDFERKSEPEKEKIKQKNEIEMEKSIKNMIEEMDNKENKEQDKYNFIIKSFRKISENNNLKSKRKPNF